MSTEPSTSAGALAASIDDRSARICIVGLGYVGVPTAVAFAQAGFDVVGVDIDAARCRELNTGRSYIDDVTSDELRILVDAGRFRAVGSLKEVGECQIVDICVPTPLGKGRDPDMSAIFAVVKALRDVVTPGQLILLTSTTYPGTTMEFLHPMLEDAGLAVGENVFLAFAPERIDPGNKRFGIRNTPKVVGGVSRECSRLTQKLFETIADSVEPVSSPAAAEMAKVLENTFRSVNIALANEVAIMCRRLGLDVWEVIEAASSKPYGFMPFYPGPGLGGHCIPVDPTYLSWKLRRLDYVARFIDLAEDINHHMPHYVTGRVAEILNERGKSVKDSRILVLGVAYKPDVPDLRESPALDLIVQLRRKGAVVSYADPHVPGPIRVDGEELSAEGLTSGQLSMQDLVVIATDHADFDWDLVRQYAPSVLDTRGVAWRRGIGEWRTL